MSSSTDEASPPGPPGRSDARQPSESLDVRVPDSIWVFSQLNTVVGLSDKALALIKRFGTKNPRVAPDALCRLYFLLELAHDNNVKFFGGPRELADLEDQLRRCRALLDRHDSSGSGSSPYTWPAEAEAKLGAELQALTEKLERELHRKPSSRRGASPEGQDGDGAKHQSLSVQINNRASELHRDRRNSIDFIDLAVTITLRRNRTDQNGERIHLKSVSIAERDNEFRTLQYENADLGIVVSHRIHRHKLPRVDDSLSAAQVYFDELQELIIKDKYGHNTHEYCPVYEFGTPEDLDNFLRHVRERNLVDKFMPSFIMPNGKKDQALARNKIVRLWVKQVKNLKQGTQAAPLVTLTFLCSLEQLEWDLTHFELATVSRSDVHLVERPEHNSAQRKPMDYTFRFSDKNGRKAHQDAKHFHDMINAVHPKGGREQQQSIPRMSFNWRRPFATGPSPPTSTDWDSATTHVESTSPTSHRTGASSTRSGWDSHYAPTDSAPSNAPHSPQPSPRLTPVAGGTPRPPANRQDFNIAIICALPIEASAVTATFDAYWDDFHSQAPHDSNAYSFGSIGSQNVVVVHMAKAGKSCAASSAVQCRRSFTKIKLCLVVGICGGVPDTGQEMLLLGDVVISQHVIQYDLVRHYITGDEMKNEPMDSLRRLEQSMLGLLKKLEGVRAKRRLQDFTATYLQRLAQPVPADGCLGESAVYPPQQEDQLFDANYHHKHREEFGNPDFVPCERCQNDEACSHAQKMLCSELRCDETCVVRRATSDAQAVSESQAHAAGRQPRLVEARPGRPAVHFGLYASGDKVMKSGRDRDLVARAHTVIAFDMEGAGVWDVFERCLVIKGVCDYADSHKSKSFQNYAAATAAACTKAFLEEWARNQAVDEEDAG